MIRIQLSAIYCFATVDKIDAPWPALGVALHLSFFVGLALWPLSQRMVLLYLAFLNPDSVHAWIDRILDPPPEQKMTP